MLLFNRGYQECGRPSNIIKINVRNITKPCLVSMVMCLYVGYLGTRIHVVMMLMSSPSHTDTIIITIHCDVASLQEIVLVCLMQDTHALVCELEKSWSEPSWYS